VEAEFRLLVVEACRKCEGSGLEEYDILMEPSDSDLNGWLDIWCK
jgi:hypothetical protein